MLNTDRRIGDTFVAGGKQTSDFNAGFDPQRKLDRQDRILDEIYAQLLLNDFDADRALDSTRQVAELAINGQTLDDVLFSGSDDINLFLSERALTKLLDELLPEGI